HTLPSPRSPHFPYTTLFRSRSSPLRSNAGETEARLIDFPAGQPLHVLLEVLPQWYAVDLWRRHIHDLAGLLADHVVVGSHVAVRSEEHTSELQSRENLVCRL